MQCRFAVRDVFRAALPKFALQSATAYSNRTALLRRSHLNEKANKTKFSTAAAQDSAENKEMSKKTFTLAEVAKHKSETDCWLVIRGKVYDVTPFLEEHPGGDFVVLEEAGTDATDAFEDIGHSEIAAEELAKLYIGDLAKD